MYKCGEFLHNKLKILSTLDGKTKYNWTMLNFRPNFLTMSPKKRTGTPPMNGPEQKKAATEEKLSRNKWRRWMDRWMTMRCIIDVHVVDETRVMSTCLYSMFFSLLYITFQFLKTYGPAQGSLIYLHQSFFTISITNYKCTDFWLAMSVSCYYSVSSALIVLQSFSR